MASLRKNGTHFCSGGLISHKHVLTAAQCIHEIDHHLPCASLGELVVLINEISYEIADTIMHPKYDSRTRTVANSFDIGIIEVGF